MAVLDDLMEQYRDGSLTRRELLKAAAALGVAASALGGILSNLPVSAQTRIGGTLNLLVYAGYEEEQVVKALAQKHGLKFNSKIVGNSDQLFSIATASRPGEWDVAAPDTPWIRKLVNANLLAPLNPGDYPEVKNFLSRWQKLDQLYVNNTLYGLVSRFGYIGIVYNTKYVKPEEARTAKVLWDPKYKGKISLLDWYIPTMGVIGRYLGYENPYRAVGADFKRIEETLYSLRPQVGLFASTPSDHLKALASESAWLTIGGDDNVASLKDQGRSFEITVPDEGGVSWTESLVIFKNSKNPAAAKAYVQHLISPEAQARLAWANAFHAKVPNKAAAKHLTKQQATSLQMDNPTLLENILKRIATREIPANEEQWKLAWERFKSR